MNTTSISTIANNLSTAYSPFKISSLILPISLSYSAKSGSHSLSKFPSLVKLKLLRLFAKAIKQSITTKSYRLLLVLQKSSFGSNAITTKSPPFSLFTPLRNTWSSSRIGLSSSASPHRGMCFTSSVCNNLFISATALGNCYLSVLALLYSQQCV